jgi:hypothetical protein
LVRVALKKPFSDGTVAVDMDPLSLLCRLAASVPRAAFQHGPQRRRSGRARQASPAHRAQAAGRGRKRSAASQSRQMTTRYAHRVQDAFVNDYGRVGVALVVAQHV